ncbi:MAG: hypothetical protein R3336_09375, partial [Phycisphaeraceae bacterium]|nr:hypothetical protein [Phycisphaeraceae bacterium]
DELDLNWWGGTGAGAIRLDSPEGETVLVVGELKAPGVSLGSLLLGGRDFGMVTADGVDVHLERDASGQWGLVRALASTDTDKESEPLRWPDGWAGRLDVTGRAEVVVPDRPPVILPDLKAFADARNRGALKVEAKSSACQDDVCGDFQLALSVDDLVGADGMVALSAAKVDLLMEAVGLPPATVDQLANAAGRWEALAGGAVDVTVTAEGPLSRVNGKVVVKAPRLEGQSQVVGSDQGLELAATRFTAQVDGQSFPKLVGVSGVDLAGTSEVVLEVESAAVARTASGLDWANAHLKARVHSTAVPVGVKGVDRPLTFERFELNVDSERLADGISVAGGMQVSGDRGSPGSMSLDARVDQLIDGEGQPGLKTAKAHGELLLRDLPAPLVERLAGGDDWTATAGVERLNVTASAAASLASGRPVGPISLEVQTAGGGNAAEAERSLALKVAMKPEGDRLVLTETASLDARIIPAILMRLRDRTWGLPQDLATVLADMSPSQPARVALRLTDLSVPLDLTAPSGPIRFEGSMGLEAGLKRQPQPTQLSVSTRWKKMALAMDTWSFLE